MSTFQWRTQQIELNVYAAINKFSYTFADGSSSVYFVYNNLIELAVILELDC